MKDIFKDFNIKRTKPRELVLDIVNHLGDNATSINILKKINKKIDNSTVYRIIDLFIEKGIFEKKINYNNEIYYSVKESHSHYFICVKCHKKELINICPLTSVEDSLDDKGYKILNHIVEIDGICKNCQN